MLTHTHKDVDPGSLREDTYHSKALGRHYMIALRGWLVVFLHKERVTMKLA